MGSVVRDVMTIDGKAPAVQSLVHRRDTGAGVYDFVIEFAYYVLRDDNCYHYILSINAADMPPPIGPDPSVPTPQGIIYHKET